jgi:hypothetical protein
MGGDYDPEKFDKLMEEKFNDDFYNQEETEKPVFEDKDDILPCEAILKRMRKGKEGEGRGRWDMEEEGGGGRRREEGEGGGGGRREEGEGRRKEGGRDGTEETEKPVFEDEDDILPCEAILKRMRKGKEGEGRGKREE